MNLEMGLLDYLIDILSIDILEGNMDDYLILYAYCIEFIIK